MEGVHEESGIPRAVDIAPGRAMTADAGETREEAGLVASQLELSADGKALNYFEVADFNLELTPAAITEAATSLTIKPEK